MAARQQRSSCSTCCSTALRICDCCRCAATHAPRSADERRASDSRLRISEQVDRRRPSDVRACEAIGLGRRHRQAARLDLQVRSPLARLVQAETGPPSDLRRRRVDRAARHPSLLWRAAARRPRRGRWTSLHRPHRRGLQRCRTRESVEAAAGATRRKNSPFTTTRRRPTRSRTGRNRGWSSR